MKMIISAGGTGGHIYPALAIIKEMQKKDKDFEVLYIGTHNRMENNIVPKENIPYEAIKIYGFSKTEMGRNIKNLGYIIKSYYRCIDIMNEFKPDIVVGVGGYVTMPVIMAAKKLKIKTVIHEQNSIPGKTNKFLSRGVDEVFLSFKESKKYFSSDVLCKYTGNPSGDNVKNLVPMKKDTLGFNKNMKLIIITSGSLGSSALNEKIIEFLKLSKNEDYEVLFITGKGNYDDVINNNKFSKNIKVIPYLDNLASLFKSSDLIISRAGAGTISEILTSKVPSILIPSPNVANNHQYYNALDLANDKLSIMLEEKDITGKILYDKIKSLLNGSDEYLELKNNLEKYKNINSSETIYNEIRKLVDNAK